ncbi:MAG: radical SAM protein [Candidatus Hodarchaeota archaeon]
MESIEQLWIIVLIPDLSQFLKISSAEFLNFKETAFSQRLHYHGTELLTYYPGDLFPSISVTGSECAMNCKYCNKHFLQHMLSAPTPDDLYQICLKLKEKGAIGCLISGGYSEKGVVPLTQFLDTIKQIKSELGLVINLHTGLVDREKAENLAKVGVDVVSFDMVGDDRIIKEVIGLQEITVENYSHSLQHLHAAGLDVIPHVGLGFYYGKLDGVERALKESLSINPRLLVFLVLWPKAGTEMENIKIPSIDSLQRIIVWTRLKKPKSSLSLGCMRPRDVKIEKVFVEGGINRIEIPRQETVEFARKIGLKVQKHHQCCAI